MVQILYVFSMVLSNGIIVQSFSSNPVFIKSTWVGRQFKVTAHSLKPCWGLFPPEVPCNSWRTHNLSIFQRCPTVGPELLYSLTNRSPILSAKKNKEINQYTYFFSFILFYITSLHIKGNDLSCYIALESQRGKPYVQTDHKYVSW